MISRLVGFSLTPIVFLVFATAAFGQSEINGRVVDPQDKPVAGLEVLLHAVTESTGTDVDKATTAADGTFKLSAGSTDQNAIFFVAVMWNDELYMGEILRQPFPTGQEYVVRVGVNPVDIPQAEPAPQLSAAEQKQNRNRGAIVIVATGLVIAGLLGYGLKRRPSAQRRWLVELARLEDDLVTDPNSSALQKRRAELRERLKAPKRG